MTETHVFSQQVSWWDVHQYVMHWLKSGPWPMLGTPQWCALPDDDPAKNRAVLDAAQHWALRVETCQKSECDASRAISAAEDWAQIGREIYQRNSFYAEKPWLRRVAS
jgi:hypothetical protein